MLYYNTVNELLKNSLLKLMKSDVFKDFRLVGGTALSLQIGHRESIDIDFALMKPNDHMTFEVLTGGLSGDLTPPICDSQLNNDKVVTIHEQVFDETTRNSKYDGLVKHLGVAVAALCVGIVLFGVAFFSKYQAFFAGKELAIREQLSILLSVDSLPWFFLFVVSMILLFFAYESSKVIAPKFRRYKFEQLIQNRE